MPGEDLGEIIEVSEYTAGGVEGNVHWFDSDVSRAGHCTPINTILMNRRPLRDISERATDYVFLHELGHARQPLLMRIVLYALFISTGFSSHAVPRRSNHSSL